MGEIVNAVGEKLKFRGKGLENVKEEFLKKEVRLKKLWQDRLSPQVSTLPEFDQVWRIVKRELRQAGFLAANP